MTKQIAVERTIPGDIKDLLDSKDVEVINIDNFPEKGLIAHYAEEVKQIIEMTSLAEDIKYSHLTKKQLNAKLEPVRDSTINPKIGRNKPCPCGSGKKFKNCCDKF